MNHMLTDTAHLYWNAEWQKADGFSPWAMPEPWAMDHSSTLAPGLRILDLGAGIGRNTWVFEGEGDKVHPHYFCNAPDLLSLMRGFEIFTLFDRPNEKPGSWHWHVLAERLA